MNEHERQRRANAMFFVLMAVLLALAVTITTVGTNVYYPTVTALEGER